MTIKFSCPKCNRGLAVPDISAGSTGKCKCGAQVTVPKFASPRVPEPSSTRTARRTPWIAGVSVLVLVLGALAAYLPKTRDTWERDNYSRLRQIMRDGTDLEQKGDFQNALKKYEQVFAEAGSRTIRDEMLRADIELARDRRHALSTRLRELAQTRALGEQRQAEERQKREEARVAETRTKEEQARKEKELASRPGTIRGGAWVVLGSGDSRILRGQEVALLIENAQRPTLDLLKDACSSAIRRLGEKNELAWRNISCRQMAYDETLFLQYFGYFAYVECMPEFLKSIATRVIALTKTSIDGKYDFKEVPPGHYCLYSLYASDTSVAVWLVPLDLAPGQELQLDLENGSMQVSHNREN